MTEILTPVGQIIDGTHYVLGGPETAEEVVVFIHGTGYTLWHFNRMAEHLAGLGYRTLQYDLIGRGFSSPHPSGKYGTEEHVQQLLGLVQKLNLPPKLHVVGHSFGGAIASCFAARHMDIVKSLILLAPAGLVKGPLSTVRYWAVTRHLVKNAHSKMPNRQKAWRSDFFSHENETLAIENEMVDYLTKLYAQKPEVFEGYFRALMEGPMYGIDGDIEKIAANPNINVQLLWGLDDTAITYKPHYERFTTLFDKKQCKFVSQTFGSAAHGFLLEKHQEVNEAIGTFLKSQST